jgi:hypothetical protein
MSDVGSTAEEPMVCTTLRWREMDSNYRFLVARASTLWEFGLLSRKWDRIWSGDRRFESISLQRRVFANLTRSIRSPKILPSELRAASVIRVYVARSVSWRGPGGKVRRLTHDRLVLRRAFADQIADDHQPSGDPDARLELSRFARLERRRGLSV